MPDKPDPSRVMRPFEAAFETTPLAPPLYLSSVYACRDPDQAAALLAGDAPGYVYRRDGHPNADSLADVCRALHGAERAVIANTGMAALALALVSQLRAGDAVVASEQLYGRSLELWNQEAPRLGIACAAVDTCDIKAVERAITPGTRLICVETISNPLLRMPDIRALAELAHRNGALLLVDNTFASPIVCRPLDLGADLVVESLTKIMNGHSDVVLGLLCGREATWERVRNALSVWGLTAAPLDCWLAQRGLGTLALRVERAGANAQRAAEFLQRQRGVAAVIYPGLADHPDHELVRRQLVSGGGTIVTFTLAGGRAAAERFIASGRIPFCPSLGELQTTVSHPESTSHRRLDAQQRQAMGIPGGMLRLSVGIESTDAILEALDQALAGVG